MAQQATVPSEPKQGGKMLLNNVAVADDGHTVQEPATDAAGSAVYDDVRQPGPGVISASGAAAGSAWSVSSQAADAFALEQNERPNEQASLAAPSADQKLPPVIAGDAAQTASEPPAGANAGQPSVIAPVLEARNPAPVETSQPAAAPVALTLPMDLLDGQHMPTGDRPSPAATEAGGDAMRQPSGMAAAFASDLSEPKDAGIPVRAMVMPELSDTNLPMAQRPLLAETAAPFVMSGQEPVHARSGPAGLDGSTWPKALRPVEAGSTLLAGIMPEHAAAVEKPEAAAIGAGTDVSPAASQPVSVRGTMAAGVDAHTLLVPAVPADPPDAVLPVALQRSEAAGLPLVPADPKDLAPHRPTGDAASLRDVPVSLAKAVGDGKTELTLALRPPELGHLTIRLQFADGQLQVDIRADRPETLHLLQREADGFERSLRQAGLDLREGGLQFSAHGDGSRQRPGGDGSQVWHGLAGDGADAMAGQADNAGLAADAAGRARLPPLPFAGADRLDLRI